MATDEPALNNLWFMVEDRKKPAFFVSRTMHGQTVVFITLRTNTWMCVRACVLFIIVYMQLNDAHVSVCLIV